MTRYYKVADHIFGLKMNEASPYWAKLHNYEPFECNEDSPLLFIAEVVDSLPETVISYTYDIKPVEGHTFISIQKTVSGEWLFSFSVTSKEPVCARMLTGGNFTSSSIELIDKSMGLFAINSVLMLLFALTSAPYQTLEFHSSTIINDGHAYLFLGKSGTGKSTHSRLWLEHVEGSELLNDDNPIIRIHENGTVMAYGSPWSGKTPCYNNLSAPIGAIVRIQQYPENDIRRMNEFNSYASIYAACSRFRAVKDIAEGQHKAMEAIVSRIPCFLLRCRPDKEAATLCAHEAREHLK